jgi:hypothetical protein
MCFLNYLCKHHTYSFFLARYIDGDGTNYRPDHFGQDTYRHGHGYGRPSHSSLGMVTLRCLAFTNVLKYVRSSIFTNLHHMGIWDVIPTLWGYQPHFNSVRTLTAVVCNCDTRPAGPQLARAVAHNYKIQQNYSIKNVI